MSNSLVFRKLFLGVSLASLAAQGYAEEGELQEVVIWGTQLSASNIVRDEEFIEIRQADHISDLLRTVPGVDVGGAHSLKQRITIRSMDDKDLQITIDGADQNSYMYHHMGNLQINLDILKAVDVSVGTNSIVDGGLGGAVHFYTKDAADLLESNKTLGGRASLSYASNDQLAYSLSGYGKLTESFDFLVYANQIDRNNYKVGGGAILDENGDEVPGTDGTVRGLEGELFNGLAKLGWNINDQHRITLGYESYKDEGDYSYRPDMGLTTDIAFTEALQVRLTFPTEFTRDTATLNYFGEIGSSTTVIFSLYDSNSNFWRDETALADSTHERSAASAGIKEGEAQNIGSRLKFESKFGDGVEHTLVYGGESNYYETKYLLDDNELSSEFSQNAAIYMQDRIQIGPSWAFIPGIRYDNVNVESTVVDGVFDEVSGALAIEFQLADNYLFKLSSTQLFKAPEIGEVFIGAGLRDVPNPDIKAETGVNSEFSFAYRNEGLNAGFTMFNTTINDYIYDYINYELKDNVGDMEINVREIYFGYSSPKLNAMITFSDANSELSAFSEYEDLDDARLDRTQGFTTSLNLDYTFEELDLKVLWESLMVDSLPAGVDLDLSSDDARNNKESYSVHNIAVRWSPRSAYGLDVTAGIDNILDEYYASQSSRTGMAWHPLAGDLYLTDVEPGRSFKLGVAYRF